MSTLMLSELRKVNADLIGFSLSRWSFFHQIMSLPFEHKSTGMNAFGGCAKILLARSTEYNKEI